MAHIILSATMYGLLAAHVASGNYFWPEVPAMPKSILATALMIVGVPAGALAVMHFTSAKIAVQRAVSPGDLSLRHAFLENNCAACHTPAKGAETGRASSGAGE
jgi:mono/diheme cytochrome c family protein